MAEIIIEKVTKKFGAFTAIDSLDTVFHDGVVTCLLGPSGCGKTTLMRMIVGLESPTTGRILFGDRDMAGLPPRKRNVGMVFQYPVMYQTLSVEENIALPLRQDRSLTRKERDTRIDEVLDVLDMRDRRGHFIDQLDAGSRQKVAVGRAVARRSDIVLFDEPTTNVEVQAKLLLIRAFKLVTQRLRQTIIYVTHDQTEAMTLADQVALMRGGRIIQYDSPERLYSLPETEFAGWFMGNPGMNFVPAQLTADGVRTPLVGHTLRTDSPLGSVADFKVGIRPEHIKITRHPQDGAVTGTVRDLSVGIAGRHIVHVSFENFEIKVKTHGVPDALPGDTVYVIPDPEWISFYNNGNRVGSARPPGVPSVLINGSRGEGMELDQ